MKPIFTQILTSIPLEPFVREINKTCWGQPKKGTIFNIFVKNQTSYMCDVANLIKMVETWLRT